MPPIPAALILGNFCISAMLNPAENSNNIMDAIVIGGGFYGAAIAIYLVKTRGLKKVLLIEREAALLTRASYNNQARVHNGYHYPRSFTTAYRSRINLPKFVQDWPYAVKRDFIKLYAIARSNSKVTVKQFERFCREIGAKIESPAEELKNLFNPHLIEKVFLAEEYAFDATQLERWAKRELIECGVTILYNTQVTAIRNGPEQTTQITQQTSNHSPELLSCRYLFNCTYSGLNQFAGDFSGTQNQLKHEITEMALIRPPQILANLGITVMDGPFFSMMPFPAQGLHTLSHVRYTPHLSWQDERGIDPYQKLSQYPCETHINRMLRDIGRYLPAILDSQYIDSLFEVKTVLIKNEGDDGRPILFEKHHELPNCYSILGGKIDNIYDIIEKLDAESFN